MVNNLYDENIQAIGGQHPICTSWAQIPLGIFFHSELIICSHSFYIPNIYQSTVYLSLYLSKLKFTVNLTFSRFVIPPQQAHYSWSLFVFFNFLYFLFFFTLLFIVSIYFENCIFERRRIRNEIKSFNDYSSVLL